MQRPLQDQEIEDLRRLQSEVNDAIESRIRNEEAAGEKVRRATQALQIAGMGQHQYWETQIAQPLKNVCLVMAQELGILRTIHSHQPHPVTSAELARISNSDELLISRILRPLTAAGIAAEVSPNTYTSNPQCAIAASKNGQAGIKIWNELLFPVASNLIPYMRSPQGFKQFPETSKGELDPTQFTHGGKSMFEYFRDENREMKSWFDTLMVENRAFNIPWFEIYPLAQILFPDSRDSPPSSPTEGAASGDGERGKVLLVDVGGNRGADLLEFHKAFPSLPGRLVLQDLPETLEHVDAAGMGRIELCPYDFFTPQPVEGAKVYFWRWVLHDFNDEVVKRFLGNTVKAMDKGSRLLVEELVLPDVGVGAKGAGLDVLMMLYHSGMERSEGQWRRLLGECGLRIVKIWKNVEADPSILECVLA